MHTVTTNDRPLQAWQRAFRDGIAPSLSTAGLEALRTALLTDDPRLVQGRTTEPPPLACAAEWPVEKGCALCLALWLGDGLRTVGQVEAVFARVVTLAGERLGEPTAARYFLNFWDDSPRQQACAELLAEVSLALASRPERMAPAAA